MDTVTTDGGRWIIVPEEDQQPIVDGYFENYKNYFQKSSLDELDNDESKLLASLIEGDVWCRKYSTGHELSKLSHNMKTSARYKIFHKLSKFSQIIKKCPTVQFFRKLSKYSQVIKIFAN